MLPQCSTCTSSSAALCSLLPVSLRPVRSVPSSRTLSSTRSARLLTLDDAAVHIQLSPASTARLAVAAYLSFLVRRPLLTKSATSGALYLFSELVSTQLAADRSSQDSSLGSNKRTSFALIALWKRYEQALKLAAYGFSVGAPLDHLLFSLLARVFSGRNSKRAKLGEVVVANVAILPLQNAVYLTALSVIGGAKSVKQIVADVRGPFLEVMQLTAIVSTLALGFAQRYVSSEALVPFLTLVAATVDTAVNVKSKLPAKAEEERRRVADEGEGTERDREGRFE